MFDDILSQWFKNTGQNGATGQGQDPYISNYRQQMANQAISNQPASAQTNPMSTGNYPLRQALYMQNLQNQGSTGFGSAYKDLNAPPTPAQQPTAPQQSMDDFGSSLNQYLPGAQHMANVLGGGAYGGSGNAGTDILSMADYSKLAGGDTQGKMRFLSDVIGRVNEYGSAMPNLTEHVAYSKQMMPILSQLNNQYSTLNQPQTGQPGQTGQAAPQPAFNPYAYAIRGYNPAAAPQTTAQQMQNPTGKISASQLPPINVGFADGHYYARYGA
jgi:hypothetical protein